MQVGDKRKTERFCIRFLLCWHLPIFPGRPQPSIFGTSGLNFRVRYGNGWTPSVFNTNFFFFFPFYIYHTFVRKYSSSSLLFSFGDSWGNRTPVAAVRGRSLNRLTNEPFLCRGSGLSLCPRFPHGAPSGARTRDTLIKSQNFSRIVIKNP